MTRHDLSRRGLMLGGAGLIGAGGLGGCDRLSRAPTAQSLIGRAETLTLRSQRLLLARQPLAREFSPRDLSPVFRANGNTMPRDPAYLAHLEDGFAGWRLRVDGLVARPLALSLTELRALPARTQITRHDCVEGWSAIGQWTGPQLAGLLQTAGLSPQARYIVFHCADASGGSPYYESIDLFDALHPQTILAHTMNGEDLPVRHGAPVRLRVERQLGYKHAKYVMRIEVADSLASFGRGRGGYWEDRGYEWYAGI